MTGQLLKFFANNAWFLIITIIIVVSLFRIWFELLKAWVMILLYTILGPLWIVFGLLPKKPLGFEKWLRVYFAHLAVFPATVFMIVGARVLYEKFNKTPTEVFVPPLIGNPAAGEFGAFLELAMIIVAPNLLILIREKLSVPPSKYGSVAPAFSTARKSVGAIAKRSMSGLNRRNSMTGAGEGAISRGVDSFRAGFTRRAFGRQGVVTKLFGGDKSRIGRGLIAADERAQNLKRGIGRRTNEEAGFSPDDPRHTEHERVQGTLRPILARDAKDRNDEDKKKLGEYGEYLTPQQRITDILRNTTAKGRSIEAKDYLEANKRYIVGSEKRQMEDEEKALAAGHRIDMTVQITGESTPRTINKGTGLASDFVATLTSDPAKQNALRRAMADAKAKGEHGWQDVKLDDLTEANRQTLETFLNAHRGLL